MSIAIASAQAQTNSPVIDGLFTPTQSQRFFEAGREGFTREVEILNYSEDYLGEDLLQIDPALIEQMSNLDLSTDIDLDRHDLD